MKNEENREVTINIDDQGRVICWTYQEQELDSEKHILDEVKWPRYVSAHRKNQNGFANN